MIFDHFKQNSKLSEWRHSRAYIKSHPLDCHRKSGMRLQKVKTLNLPEALIGIQERRKVSVLQSAQIWPQKVIKSLKLLQIGMEPLQMLLIPP